MHHRRGDLTDFIVSKVAMSICALMFMAVASGIVTHSMTLDEGSELSEMLGSLEELILLVSGCVSECDLTWSVPCTQDGSEIWLDICHSYMTASADGRTVGVELQDPVHTWEWQGESLNQSIIEERDLASDHLKLHTDDVLCVNTSLILVDELPSILLFLVQVT